MKQTGKYGMLFTIVILAIFDSCVSLQDRAISSDELSSMENLGQVTTTFTSFQPLHITLFKKSMLETAYSKLLAEARSQYQGNVDINLIDIRNIKLNGKFSGWELVYLLGGYGIGIGLGSVSGEGLSPASVVLGFTIPAAANFQKIVATGDVVIDSRASKGRVTASTKGLQGAIYRAAEKFVTTLPDGAVITVLNVFTDEDANFIIEELEFRMEELEAGFHLVTRGSELEQIRREQNFQMSGDVSDESAVSIGNMLGASIVITGSTSNGRDSNRYLTLRALDVKTGRVITTAREVY